VIFVKERKLESGIKMSTSEQFGKVKIEIDLMPIMWIWRSECQSHRWHTFIVTNSDLPLEGEDEAVTCPPTSMHLHDEVVAVILLFYEKTLGALSIDRHLVDARVASKFDEPINIVMVTVGK
jgi:hypothetical protein